MALQQPNQSYDEIIRRSQETLVKLITNTQCLLENLVNHEFFSHEDSENVMQFPTTQEKVRKIIDLVESKKGEVAEFFIYILYKIPEAYYDLDCWLTEIDFHPSEQIQSLPITNNDPGLHAKSFSPTCRTNTSGGLVNRTYLWTSLITPSHNMPLTPIHRTSATSLCKPSWRPSGRTSARRAPQNTKEWPSNHTKAGSQPAKHNNDTTKQQLSVNQITDEGVKVLAEELTKYRIIKFLGLYKNFITDLGAEHVARIIRECPLLHHVMLGYNKFTGVGGRQIAEALQTSTHIYEVGMWGNCIGDEGAKAFAETIRNHPCLEILSLACNGITSVGGRCIADALQNNKSIKTLWLTENNITDEATESFAEMLKVNETLKNLWLNNNHITNMGANIMAEALDHNTVLEDLSLHKNPLTLDEEEAFQKNSRIRT